MVDKLDLQAVFEALRRPFHESEIQWKPQVITKDKALAVAFIDARCVMDRLDEVLGIHNWYDRYERVSDSSVCCGLSIRVANEWITKYDVGSTSDQPDSGDALKAAYSDALKRAAVKFGIGRYLYQSVPQWVRYDSQRRHFIDEPRLVIDRIIHAPMPARSPGIEVQLPDNAGSGFSEIDFVSGMIEKINQCRSKIEIDVIINRISETCKTQSISEEGKNLLKDCIKKRREFLKINE